MQKVQLMALNDYIVDKTDLNLKLFIMSINPLFNLSNKKKPELLALIDKYGKDKNKLRLEAIEMYLGATPVQKKKLVKIEEEAPIVVLNEYTPEQEALLDKLNELRGEFMSNLKADSPGTVARQIELRGEMRKIESKLNLFVEGNDRDVMNQGTGGDFESKKALVHGMFGDWDTPGTPAWSLINPGGQQTFEVLDDSNTNAASFNPILVAAMVSTLSGKKRVTYTVVHDKNSSPMRYIFSTKPIQLTNGIRDNTGAVYDAGAWNKYQVDANALSMDDLRRMGMR